MSEHKTFTYEMSKRARMKKNAWEIYDFNSFVNMITNDVNNYCNLNNV